MTVQADWMIWTEVRGLTQMRVGSGDCAYSGNRWLSKDGGLARAVFSGEDPGSG